MYNSALLMIAMAVAAAPAEGTKADSATGPQVVVVTQDGKTLRGALQSLTSERVVLSVDDRAVTVERAKLSTTAPLSPPAAAADKPGVRIELVDGSVLIAAGYTAAGSGATLKFTSGEAIQLATKMIHGVRLLPPDPQADKGWAAVLAARAEGDRLAIRKQGSVDHLVGVLAGVTDGQVEFRYDGKTYRVPRAKVEGLVYFHAAAAELPPPVCRVSLADGSRLDVASLELAGGKLALRLLAGPSLKVPWGRVTRLGFSDRGAVYLSDLEPQSTRYAPLVDAGDSSAALAALYGPRRDAALEGGPLSVAKTQYSKGLAVRSRTELVYRLPGKFRRLVAVAGIDDRVRPAGNVRLEIRADGKTLFHATITGKDDPRPISLDITGAARVTILVDYGRGGDRADHLDLCQLRITR